MEINKTQSGSVCILTLADRIDTVTSPGLWEALAEALPGSDTIELDFAKVEYVSSAGLRVLLSGEKNATASGKAMRLKNVSPEVMEIFEITGFSAILKIV